MRTCEPLLDASCTLQTGESTTTDITIDDKPNFDSTTSLGTQCKALKAAKDCGTNCSSRDALLVSNGTDLPDQAKAKELKAKIDKV